MCTRTSTLSALSTLPEANFGARRYGKANGIASTAVIRTVPAKVSTAATVARSVPKRMLDNVSEIDAHSNTNRVSITYLFDMNLGWVTTPWS